MSDQQGNEAPASGFLEAEEVKHAVLPGALLAAQRQAKGWTVEHAAGHLKFAARQVLALEADNYAALPGPVTVRGFVRAYAKLLGMDSNALVAALPQDAPMYKSAIEPQRTLSTPFSESPLPLGNRSRLTPVLIIGVIVVVILAVAATFAYRTELLSNIPQLGWLKRSDDAATRSEEPQAQTDSQQEVPAEVQDGFDKDKSRLEKGELLIANAVNSTLTNDADNTEAPASEAAAPATSAPVPPVKQAVLTTPAAPAATGNLNISKGKDLLRLTFREDSWVEIRRGDKSTIISRLLKAGTSEAFDITEPVTLVVGNAGGVDASLRGSKLDLEKGTNSNVARLSLK